MRIDKLLSQLKYGSRNDIKKMISKGQIKVNHTIIHDPTYEVKPHDDHICVNDDIIFYKDPIHLAIYKPVGYLSAHHDTLHPCVMDLIKPPYHRFDFKIAGRLDLDAEGLMILTTDGMLAHELTHQNIMSKRHIKSYLINHLHMKRSYFRELLFTTHIKIPLQQKPLRFILKINMLK